MPGAVLPGEAIIRADVVDPAGDRVTLDGLRVPVGPDGETVMVIDTLPEKPLMLVSVRVELDDVPGGTFRALGLAKMLKSTTWTTTLTECVREPLVPVIVTV